MIGGIVSAEGDKAKAEVLVDVVGSPKSTEDFPGLYLGALPEMPFLGTACFPAICRVCCLLLKADTPTSLFNAMPACC